MLQRSTYNTTPPAGSTSSPPSWHLLLLSASSSAALDKATTDLAARIKQHPELAVADVARTLQTGTTLFDYRRFLVCRDRTDAIYALETVDARRVMTVQDSFRDRKVAFLFPGLGEQYVELARALYSGEPGFRAVVERCCAFLKSHLNLDLREIFSPADQPTGDTISPSPQPVLDFRALVRRSGHDASSPFAKPTMAHPATFVLEYALTALLRQWGIRPAAMLGYSLGEYVAACLSGVLSLEDALLLVTERARLIETSPRGAMLAVNLTEQEILPYLSDQVSLSAVCSRATCVLAGTEEPIDHLHQHFAHRQIACYRVTSTHAFHSPMLNPLQEEMCGRVRTIKLSSPQIPYISDVTGTWISHEQATDPTYWARHMCQTVRFADGVQQLLHDPDLFVLEVGPGRTLSSFAKQHPACGMDRMSRVQAALPAAHEHQVCQSYLLNTIGKLWQAGVPVNWNGFHAHEQRQQVSPYLSLDNNACMEVKP